MKQIPSFTISYEVGMQAISNNIMTDYYSELIKNTFNKCFGLQSCLKSVRTQGDAIVALSEKTGLRIEFIKSNLEQIINL